MNDKINEEDESSNSENYNELKKNENVKKEKNLGKILKKVVKDAKKLRVGYISSKNKTNLMKLKKNSEEVKKLKEKKLLKNIRIKLGYQEFEKWDKNYEKKLLKSTRRGVVKCFNQITEIKKKDIEEQKEEEKAKSLKSKNFLEIHGLNNDDNNNEQGNIDNEKEE